MDDGLLELFENIKKNFLVLSLEDFTTKVHNENHKLEFWSAVNGTPLQGYWGPVQDSKNTAANDNFPAVLRESAYGQLKYLVDEVIAKIKSGSAAIKKKRIAEEVVNQISDSKIKQLCLEINETPDANILSLMGSFGECLRWTLWYKGQRAGSTLNEGVDFKPLLDEAIDKPYYTDNATSRFLKEFRDNFQKSSFDMVRHSATYIPDLVTINPSLVTLEHILKITFPNQP